MVSQCQPVSDFSCNIQMADPVLNRLIQAVNSLREDNNARISQANESANQHSGAEDGRRETTESAVKRLFPSTRGTATTPCSSGPTASSATRPSFNVNTDYIKSRKKGSCRNGKGKVAKKSTNSKIVLKDVILLPSPKIDYVPRGIFREQLYSKGFAESAVEISDEMMEEEIKQKFNNCFKDKIKYLTEPKYDFVRAIGNKIISVNSGPFNGKMCKYLAKQGAVYIRSCMEIYDKDLNKWYTVEKVEEANTSSEDELLQDPFSTYSTLCSSKPGKVLKVDLSSEDTAPSTSDAYFPEPMTSHVVCPTCHVKYPVQEIEAHADFCAETSTCLPPSRRVYDDLMDIEDHVVTEADAVCDVSDHDSDVDLEDNDSLSMLKDKLVHVITKLKVGSDARQNRLHIRRKKVWNDFLDSRHSKWFKLQNKWKVTFVGETAIDDGGPRREFFTECINQMKVKLFCNGEPVVSTLALVSGEMKHAGELMVSSIVHGGPAPNFLTKWVYEYLVGGLQKVATQLDVTQITAENVKTVVSMISGASTDAQLQAVLVEPQVLDVLCDVGYRGIPSRESLSCKDKLIRSICIKYIIEPKIPMLKELEEGMNSFGFLTEARRQSKLFESLFVSSNRFSIILDDFLDDLLIEYSQSQMMKEKEEDTFKYFSDSLLEISYNECAITLKDVLKFITGTDQNPPLGLPKKIKVQFKHGCPDGCCCRPTTSTCFLTITLPVHANSHTTMTELLISALSDCYGFGCL